MTFSAKVRAGLKTLLPVSLVARYRKMRGRRALERKRRRNHALALAHAEGVHFEIDSPHVGLFAHFTWVIGFVHWAEATGRRVSVSCVSSNYGDGTSGVDWLPQILESRFPRVEAGEKSCRISLREASEFPSWLDDVPALTLEGARALFFRHFTVRGELESKARELVPVEPGVVYVGVHFRGTDKHTEARPVPHEEALAAIRRVKAAVEATPGGRTCRIFLATDDAAFYEAAAREFGDALVAQRSAVRSADGKPLHRGEGRAAGTVLACEAMVDTLALARCPVILRTASFLSGWATLLSGESLMFMLNVPYGKTNWFPDNLLLGRAVPLEDAGRAVAEHIARRGV